MKSRTSSPPAIWAGASLLVLGLLATPALADDARVDALEAKLDQALQIIEQLQAELREVKQSRVSPVSAGSPAVEKKLANQDGRIEGLEDAVVALEEKTGSRALVSAFDAKSFDLGGFLHTGFTFADGEDGSAVSMNRLTFELLFKAKLNDKISLFAAQAFIREAGVGFRDEFGRLDPTFEPSNSAAPLVIAQATYQVNNDVSIDVGRWITPHGIINIEHFPAILLDPEQPQFLRPFGAQTIFPNFQNGIKLHAQKYAGFGGDGKIVLDTYVGQFVGNTDSWNTGARLGYVFGQTGVSVGLNGTVGRRGNAGTGYRVGGVDVLYDKGPVIWKSEVYTTDEDFGENRFAVYTQPGWRIDDRWTTFYRYDFLDAGQGSGDSTEHSLGLTFKPIPNVHLRAVGSLRSLDATELLPEADLRSLQFSATYSF